MTSEQARGYLYEVLIAHLLKKNHFIECKSYRCGVLNKTGEIQGRGTQHQIDYVGLYEKKIPFTYPIRLLAECKFWTETNSKTKSKQYKRVDKSFIRQYIGVHKDISENYFSKDMNRKIRFLDIPIIFSAGGFDTESEKLAWAQGINLVSHSKLKILKDILSFINFLVDHLPKKYVTKKEHFKIVKKIVHDSLNQRLSIEYSRYIHLFEKYIKRKFHYADQRLDFLESLFNEITNVNQKTFLFATTNSGKIINLISNDRFPDELFTNTDTQSCGIYFSNDNDDENVESQQNDIVFYISFNHPDYSNRKFYFQANSEMLKTNFPELPLKKRLEIKTNYFSKLTITKEIHGMTRIITLNVNFNEVQHRII